MPRDPVTDHAVEFTRRSSTSFALLAIDRSRGLHVGGAKIGSKNRGPGECCTR